MYMIVWFIKIIDWNRFANQLRGVARNYFGVTHEMLLLVYILMSICLWLCGERSEPNSAAGGLGVAVIPHRILLLLVVSECTWD